MRTLGRKVSVVLIFALLTACSQTSTNSTGTSSLDTKNQALVSFKLTDAPNKDLKSVFVNIDHMEVVVAGKEKAGRLILAQGLGVVDLLTLQNGVTMNLQDIVAPQGISIQQIRLVLKSEGHYAVKSDDSVCELKTPSAEKTGVKIILTNKVEFEAGHEYSIVVDFDALNSVVVQGNGGCLLKPVLKLKSALKKPIRVGHDDDDDDDDNDNDNDNKKEGRDQCLLAKSHSTSKHEGEDDHGDDEGSHSASNSLSDDDHESSDDSKEHSEDSDDDSDDIAINPRLCSPPTNNPATNNTTTPDQATTTPTTDTTTNGNTTTTTPTDSTNTTTTPTTPTSSEVELVVNPDQNNTTATDGWDYTPVVDGVTPVVTQDQLGTLL